MKQPVDTPVALVLLLWLAGLAAAAQFAKFSLVFPNLESLYPQAGTSLGFLITLLSLIGIILGLVAGLIVARFGFRRILLSALVLGALVSVYQATLPPFEYMLLSRVLEGLSHLAIVVAAPTLLVQISAERHRGAVMTLWATFFGVAFTLVAWLGLPLVEIYGLPSLFLAHAVFLTIVATLLHFKLQDQKNIIASKMLLGPRAIIRRHIECYSSPFIIAPALGWLFYTLTFVSLLTLLPLNVEPQQRTFAAGAMPIASIVVSMTLGILLLRKFTAVQIIIARFGSTILLTLLLLITPQSLLLYIGLFGALGLVQGASFAAIPQLNSDAYSQALSNGAMAQMGNMGNTLGLPLMLVMVSLMGFKGLIAFVLICHLLGIVIHIGLGMRRKINPQQSNFDS